MAFTRRGLRFQPCSSKNELKGLMDAPVSRINGTSDDIRQIAAVKTPRRGMTGSVL